jgi:hypothetical protein
MQAPSGTGFKYVDIGKGVLSPRISTAVHSLGTAAAGVVEFARFWTGITGKHPINERDAF